MITPAQIIKARILLKWPRSYLAARARVSVAAVQRAESYDLEQAVTSEQCRAIQQALNRGGVEFIAEPPGVRVKELGAGRLGGLASGSETPTGSGTRRGFPVDRCCSLLRRCSKPSTPAAAARSRAL